MNLPAKPPSIKDKNLGRSRSAGEIWHRTPAGILIPQGMIRESADRRSTNSLGIKERAEAVEALYAEAGVSLSPVSALGKFIANARDVSDRWLSGKGQTYPEMFATMHMMRIGDAVLSLQGHPRRAYYLERLLAGEVDFFKRVESDAKNVLWELEFWSNLKRRNAPAELQDPPDIVANLTGGTLGIACKKVYSEKNFEKTLSQAVKQVKDFEIGIVAINIDDVTPADTVLNVRNHQEMNRKLHGLCEEFLQRHERHLRQYLNKERLVAALVSIHVVADVRTWRVRFNNAWSATIWSLPELSPEKRAMTRQFADMVTGPSA
ncbi:MAG: hypothetical protein A3I63_08055 [Betaproteobacteria bacterium RIFCSPLOWO2_02_FULL_66_14]|nr:MAG: hypothetical protein A3I63_08055 [Betaproteobacteria bacterium RIFCSPLOWO2_02_FULL_66_14]